MNKDVFINFFREFSPGAMARVLDYDLEISEFELQSHYWVYFRINALVNGMNRLIPPAYGLIVYLLFYKRIAEFLSWSLFVEDLRD